MNWDVLTAGHVRIVHRVIRSRRSRRMRSRIRGRRSLVFRLQWRMVNVMVAPIITLCRKRRRENHNGCRCKQSRRAWGRHIRGDHRTATILRRPTLLTKESWMPATTFAVAVAFRRRSRTSGQGARSDAQIPAYSPSGHGSGRPQRPAGSAAQGPSRHAAKSARRSPTRAARAALPPASRLALHGERSADIRPLSRLRHRC